MSALGWSLAGITPTSGPSVCAASLMIASCHVWTAPSWQELCSRLQHWSVQPCVRPLSAAHRAAGRNALRGSVPVNSSHAIMRWHKCVVLIAGSTGSALRAVRPPNLHITPATRRDLVCAASDGLFVSLTPCHHDPDHPRNFIGKRDGSHAYRPTWTHPSLACVNTDSCSDAADMGLPIV